MTSPGGGAGPIETAYILIKPKVSANFATEIRKQVLPVLAKVSREAGDAFKNMEGASRDAAKGVQSVTRSLNSASKAADKYTQAAGAAANASQGLGRAQLSVGRALRDSGDGADRAGDSARRAGASFNFLTRALIIGAVYEAGKGLKELGAFGLQAAANLEQTRIAFEGLMGGAGNANAFIKRLQDFAAKTPFEFDELATASQRLLSIGQTGDQAIQTLTTVGNAAAAVGADQASINRVITALAQIQAKGKLSAEEINQVGEALPNLDRSAVIQNLADTFGKTTQEIQKLQQKGLIPADAGIAALLKSLQEVPGAMGAMDRQALTLIGRFSTFKDTIKANFANSIESSLPIIGQSLDRLTGVVSAQLDSLGPAIAQSMVTVQPLIEGLVNTIGPILTNLLNSVAPILAQLGPALTTLGTSIGSILGALGPALVPVAAVLAQIVAAAAPIITILGGALSQIITGLQPLLAVIGQVVQNVFAAAAPILKQLLDAAMPLVGVLATALIPVVQALGDTMIALLPSLLPLIKSFSDLVIATSPLITLLGVALAGAIRLVMPFIQILVEKRILQLRITFEALAFVIKNIVVPTFKFLMNVIIDFINVAAQIAAKAFGWIPGLGGKLKQAADSVAAFKDSVNASLAGIQTEVAINVTTTYTIAEQQQNIAAAARQARIDAIAKAEAPGGRINQLTPEDKADIAARVDAQIAAETAARKKVSPPKAPKAAGAPKLLEDTAGAASAANDKIKDALNSMADVVRDKIKKIESFLSRFRQSFEAIIGKIRSFTEVTALAPDAASATAAGILKTLETRVAALRLMTANLARLQKKGLDNGVLEQLAKAGPENRGFISALVQASPEQIRALNAAEKQARGFADTFARQATDREFGKGALAKNLAALAEQNRRLANIEKLLNTQPALLAKAFKSAEKSGLVTVGRVVT